MLANLIVILSTAAIAYAQTTGVNIVTPPLEPYIYQVSSTEKTVFSNGVFAQDSFSNSPIACNGNWVKSDVQMYNKGTCFNIPPVTTENPLTKQAQSICNFAYTITDLQTSFAYPNPTFVASPYVNNPNDGCSYQLLLDVSKCSQTLYLPYFGQGCQPTVGTTQYQTTLIGTNSTFVNLDFKTWNTPWTNGSSPIDCSKTNPANMNKLNANPQKGDTGTSTIYQCGAPKDIISDTPNIPICNNGVAARCLYSISDVINSPLNLLVMSSWNNNLGQGCTGNVTSAQVVATGTCFSATKLSVTDSSVEINGNKLTLPYAKATVGTSGQTYTLNYYHTETNCMASSNAVETFVGSLNTCLTEDDHPSSTDDHYAPSNIYGQTNRIQVSYYPSTYTCNNGGDDDNYCTITSGGIAGIVIAVVFVVFLLLVILFMCIRYCGKAPASSGAAPTVSSSQSKGGEGNPLLAGSV